MKVLLRILALVICFSFLPFRTLTAFGDSNYNQYLRVINDYTPFYRNAFDSEPLFYLPYTYYVKVLDKQNGLVHVECYGSELVPSIDGYVPENALFSDGLAVNNPYLNLTVTTVDTTPFYSDNKLLNKTQYIFKDRTLTYYGQYLLNGKIIYYVSYNDRLGYVEENYIFPFTVNNHPNPLTFLTPTEPEGSTDQNDDKEQSFDNKTLKLVIIACLIFAGIIALIFTLKITPKKNQAKEFYDENDFS